MILSNGKKSQKMSMCLHERRIKNLNLWNIIFFKTIALNFLLQTVIELKVRK